MSQRRLIQGGIGLATGSAVVGALLVGRLPRVRDALDTLLPTLEVNAASHLLWFALGQVAIAACGILPAAMMAVMAGALYGVWQGMAISVVCTMMGGWLAFLLSRGFLRPVAARMIGRHAAAARFDRSVAAEGWRFVCLLRISPIMPFAATSYGLGLTDISQRHFLIGTTASLPSLLGYVALGAFGMEGLVMGAAGASPLHLALLALGALSVIWAIARVGRVMRSSFTTDVA